MAVTLHNATLTAGPVSATNRVLLHTATAGSCLLVWTHVNTAVSMSAVAAGGVAMSRLGLVSAGTSTNELWGLTSPGSGILTISAVLVGAAISTWSMIATSYVGQKTTASPFGTVVKGTATGTTTVLSVSSTTADIVAFGFGLSAVNGVVNLNGGAINRGNATHSTTGVLVVGELDGATTVSASASSTVSGVWGMIGVPIVASATTSPYVRLDNARITGNSVAANSRGLLLTATSGAVLVVFTTVGSPAVSVSAVNVGGVAITRSQVINYRQVAGLYRTEMWVLTAPASGVLTISSQLVGATVLGGCLAGMTFVNQKTTGDPFGGVAIASGSSTATVILTVSSTTGNRVAMVFGFDEVSFSAMHAEGGVTNRGFVSAGGVGAMVIADAPGATNITAIAQCPVTTMWGAIGINIIASSVAVTSAIAAFTDAVDTFSATGYVVVRASMTQTDTPDKFTASAQVIVRGSATFTDVADKFTASAAVRVTAVVAFTGVTDTLAATAQVRLNARLSATEAVDTFSASGYSIVRGTILASDVADRFTASVGVIVQAFLSATDAPDRFTASAAVSNARSATLIATDPADVFSASAYVLVRATFTATDAPDRFTATATAVPSFTTAVLAFTDSPDILSASGYSLVSARLNATDTPDVFSATVSTVASAAAAAVIVQDGGSGGGGHKKKPEYIRAPSDFWEARERYLLALQPELEEPEADISPANVISVVEPIAPDPAILPAYRFERAEVIKVIESADNMRELRAAGTRLRAVNRQITEQLEILARVERHQRVDRLNAIKIRRIARAKLIKKKRVLAAALELAQAVVHAYGNLPH